MAHAPTPAHSRPTPIWLGWLIDAAEVDVERWAAERRQGRQRFLRRSRTLAWATMLGCLAWQLSLVRRAGGGLGDLLSAGDPALLSVGLTLLLLVYGVGSLQWWLHERKYRRLVRRHSRPSLQS
ncbi:MAG TPA: hypothetical protein VFS05_15715 [Gemmatimonadaceae bacterium]|nr:hypothetical protein [Gemmatimonadaceae bacterium]